MTHGTYILEEKLRSSASFEQILFDNFRDYSMEPHKAPYELMRWDYFLTETFEPEVKSRVPVGIKNGDSDYYIRPT